MYMNYVELAMLFTYMILSKLNEYLKDNGSNYLRKIETQQ